jgi:hypothetical protein
MSTRGPQKYRPGAASWTALLSVINITRCELPLRLRTGFVRVWS